ncbi:MAG: rhodanese-like domain-containing protein [Myxococcales bacterium]|nr:rhodanese-like domain-containing protein [Myxococcales bacterium]
MHKIATVLPAAALLGALACGSPQACPECPPCAEVKPAPGEEASAASAPQVCQEPARYAADLLFERSPGGVPEVSALWLVDHRCDVRVLDIREEPELDDELGHLPGVEWISARELPAAAESWDPDIPLVLVDRSGRRSARAVAYLEGSGFRRVAGLTGGLLAWNAHGLPVSRGSDYRAIVEGARAPAEEAAAPAPAAAGGPLGRESLIAHIGDPGGLRWTKAAALLLHGSEACVDGRDVGAVLGTPGGDAGELLLVLATKEAFGDPLSDQRIWLLLEAYLDAFGSFYIHTDKHALEHLRGELLADPRFADQRELLADVAGVERFVRHPPRALEEALLQHLVDPANVGCGHLRLILQHPDEYRVREGLSQSFLAAVFRQLWRGESLIDYVVLSGEHHESGVVRVLLGGEVQPFSRVPAIAPRRGDLQVFVDHPQVATFCRQQNVAFLLERDAWLRAHEIDAGAFLRAVEELAAHQLGLTLGYLAAGLPVFEARFHGDGIEVVGPLE